MSAQLLGKSKSQRRSGIYSKIAVVDESRSLVFKRCEMVVSMLRVIILFIVDAVEKDEVFAAMRLNH